MNHQIKVMLQSHFDQCQLIQLATRHGETSTVVGTFDSELDALIYLRETWLGRLPLHSPWLANLPATVNILTNSVTYDLTQAVADMERYFGAPDTPSKYRPISDLQDVIDRRKVERLQKSARDHQSEYAKARPDDRSRAMHWWNGLSKADRDFLRVTGDFRLNDSTDIKTYYGRYGKE